MDSQGGTFDEKVAALRAGGAKGLIGKDGEYDGSPEGIKRWLDKQNERDRKPSILNDHDAKVAALRMQGATGLIGEEGERNRLLLGKGQGGSGIGLGASMGSRSDIDRSALNEAMDINAKANIKVQVGGATAAEKVKKIDFLPSDMKAVDQLPHTSTGGASVDETAKQYMASR
jgi:hypothetical protein